MSEIERSFLVERPPDGLGDGSDIRQAYVAIDDDSEVEVRVRRRDEACTLTVKRGSGIERSEIEIGIDQDAFDELWAISNGRTIEKRRHLVDVDGRQAELDEYVGTLSGLWRVEVEFDDRREAEAFDPPGWFGRDVTDDLRYSNAELARNGVPSS